MKRRAVPVWEVILTGRLDAEGKRYVNNKKIFADAFNYLIYSGKQIIKPEALHPVDTTEITIPYGNGARTTVQKYRDTLKIWSSMQDENCMYILLGAEIQNKGHYAMPVRAMLYDALNYASQVDEARNSYRKKNEEGDIVSCKGSITIKLSRGEFLRDALNMDLEFSEPVKEGEVDMCKAVADYTLKEKILAVIEMMKSLGYSEEDIIKNVLNQYDVTEQYVHDLMHSAA